jgi:hypothetical protein
MLASCCTTMVEMLRSRAIIQVNELAFVFLDHNRDLADQRTFAALDANARSNRSLRVLPLQRYGRFPGASADSRVFQFEFRDASRGAVMFEDAEPLVGSETIRKLPIRERASIPQINESRIDTSKPFDEYGRTLPMIIVVDLVEEEIQMGRPALSIRNRTVDDVVNSLRQLRKIR